MIDIENEIFDACAKLVLAEYPDATVSSANVMAPSSFPAVSIVEADNRTDSFRNDSSSTEKGAIVAYDIKVYSNRRIGAKTQAKEILKVIDEFMDSHNFTRTYRTQGPQAQLQSVYQITARYIAGVDNNGKLYRRQ